MSLAYISLPEAPFPLVGLRRETAPLEAIPDLEETLAASTDHRLLERVSMGILLVGLDRKSVV